MSINSEGVPNIQFPLHIRMIDSGVCSNAPYRLRQAHRVTGAESEARTAGPPHDPTRLMQVRHGQAVVRSRDTGIGIAPEVLPQLFDLFKQADQAVCLPGEN